MSTCKTHEGAPRWLRGLVVLAPLGVLLAVQSAAQEGVVRTAMEEQAAVAKAGIRTQAQIDKLSDDTAELLADYRLASQSLDRVKIYNEHLQTIVNDQEREKASINRQLEDFVSVEQEIVPLMMRMIDDLSTFIDLDLPFQLEERHKRVADLRANMDRADISVSEKYRQIMEAYKIETDFGRDVEAYPGWLDQGGTRREVDFFRVGRIFLGYQTRDRAQTGFWNREKSPADWDVLPDEYRNFIKEGLAIARKQAAPDLLKLPVPAPEVAK